MWRWRWTPDRRQWHSVQSRQQAAQNRSVVGGELFADTSLRELRYTAVFVPRRQARPDTLVVNRPTRRAPVASVFYGELLDFTHV